ncbi:glycosyltransferase [Pseudomonas sp. CFBP 13727]|uniref:glycosyltransferase n=1 Tax=Pseudomonas sp. CFBP 13727 TaxID=2775295 RepID=UPI00178165CC|nr:glycosyltransferase [Pseudomonas sp. CFBP 13727]MBD8621588.1 glycosyltransferase [Pseudomonas sp. CFBP 13727]
MLSIANFKNGPSSSDNGELRSLNIDEYSQAIPRLEVIGLLNFYQLHLAIWQLRADDLQTIFDIDTVPGKIGFLAWCASSGMSEYQALYELQPFRNELNLPALIPETRWSAGISRLIQLAVFVTPELKISYLLENEHEQLTALTWYFCLNGHKSFPAPGGVPRWQKDFLIDQVDLLASRLAQLVYKSRPDVRAAFDLKSITGIEGFRAWMSHSGLVENGLIEVYESRDSDPTPKKPVHTSAKPFGVNLIGYAFGELGIGEDVRMAAKSLHAAKIPFTVINYDPGDSISQNDHSIEEWVGNEFCFSINLFCLTALEHFRFYAENGAQTVNGYYNIGYWPWELQNWPANWIHCFSLVDEIWGSSKHIVDGIRRAGFHNSILMPMAVSISDLPPSKNVLRAQINIEKNSTAFIFSFDGNSSFRRKNPIAILAAFKEAFPENRKNVALVIKCMRADSESASWRQVQNAAKRDDRIVIINEVMTKPQVIALYNACDCFVSLHRAEGFGRGIAEALLLGLDVVATNYGGNVDFCRPLDSLLVDFELVETCAQSYVESKANFWAEPTMTHAAFQMRIAASKERAAYRKLNYDERMAKLHRIFSHEAIGSQYRERLIQINSASNIHSITPHVN